jgi:myo-inositol-1(or 4)-monophosphatase
MRDYIIKHWMRSVMSEQSLLQQLEREIPRISQQILGKYFNQTTAATKTDGSIVTEADTAMQQAIKAELQRLAPGIALLGEEMTPQQQADIISTQDSYWCLDPLDGTNNFHHGVPLFAVSLALIERGELTLALVYDPVREECFSASRDSGLRINAKTAAKITQPTALDKCLASVDFKRLAPQTRLKLCEKMPFKSQRNIGTCALEWAWLAAGRCQLLLHGGEKFWDYAAGCLLLQQAGGFSSSDGEQPIFNNTLEARPVIAASTAQLYRQWVDFIPR